MPFPAKYKVGKWGETKSAFIFRTKAENRYDQVVLSREEHKRRIEKWRQEHPDQLVSMSVEREAWIAVANEFPPLASLPAVIHRAAESANLERLTEDEKWDRLIASVPESRESDQRSKGVWLWEHLETPVGEIPVDGIPGRGVVRNLRFIRGQPQLKAEIHQQYTSRMVSAAVKGVGESEDAASDGGNVLTVIDRFCERVGIAAE